MNQYIQTFPDHEAVYPDHESAYPDFLSLIMNQFIQTFSDHESVYPDFLSLIINQYIQTFTDHEPAKISIYIVRYSVIVPSQHDPSCATPVIHMVFFRLLHV